MKKKREETHIWLAISITFTLAAYRLSVGLVESFPPGAAYIKTNPLHRGIDQHPVLLAAGIVVDCLPEVDRLHPARALP